MKGLASKAFEPILGGLRHIGATTLFVLVNGLVISAIVFVILNFMTGDLKIVDARNMTRDILRATEQSMASFEKTVKSLGQFYAAQDDVSVEDTQYIRRAFVDDRQVEGFLWTTSNGQWVYDDVYSGKVYRAYNADIGWPNFMDLEAFTDRLSFGDLLIAAVMPWQAFEYPADIKVADRSIGFIVKERLPQGGIGYAMVTTTPTKLFGSSWATQREGLERITISDRETGAILLDNIKSGISENSSFDPIRVNYVLEMGGRFWNIGFDVMPTRSAKLLAAAPWMAMVFIMAMTLVTAGFVQRRHLQEMKIAEMSKTLQGTHSELQSRISERDQLFHTLRRSEREHRALINSVSDVIFETDENGFLVFLNNTWQTMTSRDVEEGIGKRLFSMIDPNDGDNIRTMFEELVRGQRQSFRVETKLEASGGLKAVEIAFSMLRVSEDKGLRVVGTITDIEKRRRAEQALREAEKRYRAIVENSISGIYQITPDGRFISANPALAEMLGYDNTEQLIHEVTEVCDHLYVDSDERRRLLEQLLLDGKLTGVESEVYRKDGGKIWVLENTRVVRDDEGKVLYYEGSMSDITESRHANEAMRAARIEAEIASRSRMEFLANMSHELRTPLNAVIGFSEIIKDEVMGPLGNAEYKEYAKDIYNSGNALMEIISEILEVSRIETGNRDLNIHNFPLKRALDSCLTIMGARIEASGVKFKTDIPDDLPELLAEELGFKQILLNLISNAVKFTEKGGSVMVSARVDDDKQMVIDVTDTGIGMTADEMKRALEPFGQVQTAFSRDNSGTGLGLTIVESLVRLHGGKFTLMSEKGKGTTARIILPKERVFFSEQSAPNALSS